MKVLNNGMMGLPIPCLRQHGSINRDSTRIVLLRIMGRRQDFRYLSETYQYKIFRRKEQCIGKS